MPEAAGAVLAEMIGLARRPPHILFNNSSTSISAQFSWIGEPVAAMLKRLLEKSSLRSDEAETAARAVWLLGQLQTLGELHREPVPDLNAMTRRHLQLRRLYFWRCVDEYRASHKQEPAYFGFVLGHHNGIQPIAEDVEWLIDDIGSRDAQRDRELALRFAFQVSYMSPRQRRWRTRIRQAAARDPSLQRLYAEIMAGTRWSWIRAALAPLRPPQACRSFLVAHRWIEIQQRWRGLRDKWFLLRHLRSIASGRATGLLSQSRVGSGSGKPPSGTGGMTGRNLQRNAEGG